jgi:hypothetical protein
MKIVKLQILNGAQMVKLDLALNYSKLMKEKGMVLGLLQKQFQ